MELRINPLEDNGIRFNSVLLDEKSRSYITLLDSTIRRKSSFIILCSWCKMVNVAMDHWVDVEVAVKLLNIFKSGSYPKLSHRICPDCSSRLRTEIINTREVSSPHDANIFVA